MSVLTFCSSVVTSCSDFTNLNLRSLICLLASPTEKKIKRTKKLNDHFNYYVILLTTNPQKFHKSNVHFVNTTTTTKLNRKHETEEWQGVDEED